MAAEAGKDAYVEKPMGNVLEEAKAARDAVKKNGRIVQVGTQHRSEPHPRAAHDVVQTRVGGKPLQRRRGRLVADRHQTRAGRDDAERRLDEAATLARDEPTARRRRDAVRPQPAGMRVDALDERRVADQLRRRAVDDERGVIRPLPCVDANRVDDRHASAKMRARTAAGVTASSATPASAASAAAMPIACPVAIAVPITRSAPSASCVAETQRPAMPRRGCVRLTRAPSGIELGPAGYSKWARR